MLALTALRKIGSTLLEVGDLTQNMAATAVKAGEKALSDPKFNSELEKGFDIVIVYFTLPNDIGLYLAHKTKAKLVLYTTGHGPEPIVQWTLRQPFHPSYQTFSGYIPKRSHQLSFFQRVFNVIAVYLQAYHR